MAQGTTSKNRTPCTVLETVLEQLRLSRHVTVTAASKGDSMAPQRRDVHGADLPGFSQTPLTRRTVIAGAGAAIAAVGGHALFGPLGTAVADELTVAPDKPWKHAIGDPRGSDIASTAESKPRPFWVYVQGPAGLWAARRIAEAASGRRWGETGTELDNPVILSGEVFLGQFY